MSGDEDRVENMHKFLDHIKPVFWDHKEIVPGEHGEQYVFRQKWKGLVALISTVTIIPLIFATYIYYHINRITSLAEMVRHTTMQAHDAALDISLFLKEYMNALEFAGLHHNCDGECSQEDLDKILHNLHKSFGGFADLAIFDKQGSLVAYSGPFYHERASYDDRDWLAKVKKQGHFVTSMFLGSKKEAHLAIAIRYKNQKGEIRFVRSNLNNYAINALIAKLRIQDIDDIFLIHKNGALLTPSIYYGRVRENAVIPVPDSVPGAMVLDYEFEEGPISSDSPLIVGAAPVEGGSNIILEIVKARGMLDEYMKHTRKILTGFMLPVTLILFVGILYISKYVITSIYLAELRRREYLSQIERTDKLASIGRLAAGVAHEVNNPLAIINEKAGLLRDLFTFTHEYQEDPRVIKTVDAIIKAVDRAGTITHRLLGFARQMDVRVGKLDLEHIIREVIGFVKKEAEYKSISVVVEVDPDIPVLVTDRGKVQQIFLNLVTNAIAAMDEGGELRIVARPEYSDRVSIAVIDNGCGISEENLKLIFEPFFSTKTKSGGTGLGLAITYGLVEELGGTLEVQSQVGVGTTFIVTLPYKISEKNAKSSED